MENRKSALVVLFGHENSEAQLSSAAVKRCESAARFYFEQKADDVPDLLITGAFGPTFNSTPMQHHLRMRICFLELIKDREDRKLPRIFGAPTSFTLEDVAYIRKFFFDGDYTEMVFITNSFHLERVQFFAAKLLPDVVVDYLAAEDPNILSPNVTKKEKDEMKKLLSEWVDVPLPDKNREFPTEIYKNASDEHKHDDSISNTLLAAAFTVMIAPHLKDHPFANSQFESGAYLGSAIAGYLCWKLYSRYATFAKIARHTLRIIETVYFANGFSYNYTKYSQNYGLNTWFRTRNIVGSIVGLLFILNIYFGSRLLEWERFMGFLKSIFINLKPI